MDDKTVMPLSQKNMFPVISWNKKINNDYWESIGIDTSVEHSDDYYWKAMNKSMSDDWKKHLKKLKEDAKNKIPVASGNSAYISDLNASLKGIELKNIMNNYPPHIQNTLLIYVESFEIPVEAIPGPMDKKDKSRYGWWCQDLEVIKNKCGQHLSASLVRAKRNFDNRHGSAWELTDHPLAIGKVLDSAIEEVKIEADTIFEPKKIEVSEDKEHLSSLRGIFD